MSLLGPATIERAGRSIAFDTRKAIALVAYLAVTGQRHARERLAAMFWPEADEERARGALRRTLSTIRTSDAGDWLVVDGASVGLRRDGLDVDVERFRTLRSEGRLAQAVDLYRGDFLSGFSLRDSPDFDEWQTAQADALRGELSETLEQLVVAQRQAGRFADALAYARRWLALDPLHEPAHRELIRLFALTGDRAAAIRQYHECVRLLDRELGVAPLPETTRLYEAIREGKVAPEDVSLARSRIEARSVEEAIGDLHTLHGAYTKAIASYTAAAATATPPARAALEHKIGEVHHRRGDWKAAEKHYRAALQDADDARRARILADWSLAAHRGGDKGRAVRLARQALEIAERAKDPHSLAQAHNIVGILTSDRSELQRALGFAEKLADPAVRIAALNNLALAHRRAGEHERALELTEAALDACVRLGDRHREAALRNNLADVLNALGRKAEAMRHLKRAVTIFSEIGDPDGREAEVWKLVEW